MQVRVNGRDARVHGCAPGDGRWAALSGNGHAYLQLSSSFGWSLANLVAMLRMNLFTHRDLMAWISAPFTLPRFWSTPVT